MIEMTWGQIRDPGLAAALGSLARQKMLYATTLKILTITKAVEAEQKKAEDMAKILRDKYMKQVEDTDETGKKRIGWELKDAELAEEFNNATKEFLDTKFKIRSERVRSTELGDTKVSAIDLYKLEAVVDFEEGAKPSRLKPVPEEA